jgi:ketosteroid isomerase-like protein
VRAWAAAWSARDVVRYLAAYAPDFTPPRGQDRKAWEADRRARITDKTTISVSIDSLVISVQGQAASASFQQTYSADKLREKSRKTLELQRVGNQWLIRKESAG